MYLCACVCTYVLICMHQYGCIIYVINIFGKQCVKIWKEGGYKSEFIYRRRKHIINYTSI